MRKPQKVQIDKSDPNVYNCGRTRPQVPHSATLDLYRGNPLTAIAQGYNQLMAPPITSTLSTLSTLYVLLGTNCLLVSKCLQLKITDSVSATVLHHPVSLRKTSCSQQTQLTLDKLYKARLRKCQRKTTSSQHS